jgi:hypothetical protein
MEPNIALVDLIRDHLDPLSDEERDALDPAALARRFPEVARLNEEDVHLVVEGYISRVDYAEGEMHGVRGLLLRAREIARGGAPAARQPGDEARPGSAQTAENLCRDCGGTGLRDGAPCPACGGSGRVVGIVGDA